MTETSLPKRASELFIEREKAWDEAWTGYVNLHNLLRRRKGEMAAFETVERRAAAERVQRMKYDHWFILNRLCHEVGLLGQEWKEMLRGYYKDTVSGHWLRDYAKEAAA